MKTEDMAHSQKIEEDGNIMGKWDLRKIQIQGHIRSHTKNTIVVISRPGSKWKTAFFRYSGKTQNIILKIIIVFEGLACLTFEYDFELAYWEQFGQLAYGPDGTNIIELHQPWRLDGQGILWPHLNTFFITFCLFSW